MSCDIAPVDLMCGVGHRGKEEREAPLVIINDHKCKLKQEETGVKRHCQKSSEAHHSMTTP